MDWTVDWAFSLQLAETHSKFLLSYKKMSFKLVLREVLPCVCSYLGIVTTVQRMTFISTSTSDIRIQKIAH